MCVREEQQVSVHTDAELRRTAGRQIVAVHTGGIDGNMTDDGPSTITAPSSYVATTNPSEPPVAGLFSVVVLIRIPRGAAGRITVNLTVIESSIACVCVCVCAHVYVCST